MERPKVVVVMPGLNVAGTLERTVRAIPEGSADVILLVDDGSTDDTVEVARSLGIACISHAENRGYGAAQKTGFREALALGADVAVMVHPDFQYKPELVPAMAAMVTPGEYDVVLGSRILLGGALAGGMPRWKDVANRALTLAENLAMGTRVSEFHTGYRAYSRRALSTLPLAGNRNDFAFDSEILAQAAFQGLAIGELSCPANYFDEMQTITLLPGIRYGFACLGIARRAALHRLAARTGLPTGSERFDPSSPGLTAWTAGRWSIPPSGDAWSRPAP